MSATPQALATGSDAAGEQSGSLHRSSFLRDARLAFRLLGREWHSGELRVLISALLVAVAGITAVGFFVDRIEGAMEGRASQLLASDLLVTSRDPIPEELEVKAKTRGLATARTLTMRSVVLAGETMRLTEVKAVTKGYPLRGTLMDSSEPFGQGRRTNEIPASGTAWLEGRLLAALGLQVGDRFELGAASFTIDRVLVSEPDRGGQLFNIAPRVMINMDDVEATQLVLPGSRVRHRLLFAGETGDVDDWRLSLDGQLPKNLELQGIRSARPELRRALERAEQFLGLAALVGVMLAGAAIAVSASRHARRHLDTAALMRCMGASQRSVVRIFALQLLVLALACGCIGSGLGYLGQFGLSELVGGLVVKDLPTAGVTPLLAGMAIALVTLAGFGVPPLARLKDVPPARVLRRDLTGQSLPSWAVYASSLVTLALIAWWQAGHWKLAAMVLGGTIGTVIVLAGGAWLMVKGLNLGRTHSGSALRFAIAGLTRRASSSVAQVVAFGLGMLALMLLTLVRGELLDEWKGALPADAPNFFLINIQPDEVNDVRNYLEKEGLQLSAFYPFIRGRISSVNGEQLDAEGFADPRARRLSEREHNLSFVAMQPTHNTLSAGRWWNPNDSTAAEFSVEHDIARTLGLEIGDALAFDIAGEEVVGKITSTRNVEWESFNVNFFFVGNPALMQEQPATYATSFHLPEGERRVLAEMVRRFPSITVMDVDALMTQVRGIMDHASTGIEYVFGFTLIAGLMVLLATIQSTLDERRHESAVLRTLGARRKLLVSSLLIEFALLGALAGALSAAAANVIGLVVADQIFGFSLSLQPEMWLAGVGFGAVGVAVAGYLGTRSVLNQPPLHTLREG